VTQVTLPRYIHVTRAHAQYVINPSDRHFRHSTARDEENDLQARPLERSFGTGNRTGRVRQCQGAADDRRVGSVASRAILMGVRNALFRNGCNRHQVAASEFACT